MHAKYFGYPCCHRLTTGLIVFSCFFLSLLRAMSVCCWWWWWIVFVERLTNGKCFALFPAGDIVGDSHHHKLPTYCQQELSLIRTWAQTIWGSCAVVIITTPQRQWLTNYFFALFFRDLFEMHFLCYFLMAMLLFFVYLLYQLIRTDSGRQYIFFSTYSSLFALIMCIK